jgi:hypothetical protein
LISKYYVNKSGEGLLELLKELSLTNNIEGMKGKFNEILVKIENNLEVNFIEKFDDDFLTFFIPEPEFENLRINIA